MKGKQAKDLFCDSSPSETPLNGSTSNRFSGMSWLPCVLGVDFCLVLFVWDCNVGGEYVLARFSSVTRLWPLSSNRFMINCISFSKSFFLLQIQWALQSSP